MASIIDMCPSLPKKSTNKLLGGLSLIIYVISNDILSLQIQNIRILQIHSPQLLKKRF